MILHWLEGAALASAIVFFRALAAHLSAPAQNPRTETPAPAENPGAPFPAASGAPMSDLSVTGHNLAALAAGKITFSEFRDGELALLRKDIASLPAAAQPAVNLLADSVAAGASALVGIGMTAIGPILNDTTDHQATMVLNLLQMLGVPTAGPISLAERAVVMQVINGLKVGLDHVGLKITSAGIVATSAPAPTPNLVIPPTLVIPPPANQPA